MPLLRSLEDVGAEGKQIKGWIYFVSQTNLSALAERHLWPCGRLAAHTERGHSISERCHY